jgi:hypothetical protein
MPRSRRAAAGATTEEIAMIKKSSHFTVINSVADAVVQQHATLAARPLATCLAAFLSIALGTAVGFVVPTGVPHVSTVAATLSTSQEPHLPLL